MDLNLQFPAGWEQAKKIKFAQGFNKPAPRDFVGFSPLTEPEALSIYNFTLMVTNKWYVILFLMILKNLRSANIAILF